MEIGYLRGYRVLAANHHRVYMTEPTERDPLIKNARLSQTAPVTRAQHKNGPLEISRSRRYGILAGIWSATFLSVSTTACESGIFTLIMIAFQGSK